MLGKLLKYDMRAISRTVLPMFAASGIISVICCAALYFTYGYSEEADSIMGALLVTSGFYTLGVIAIGVLWLITAFVCISRYYKSLFTDEGYLNMVLPIETKTLFSAKLSVTFIWIAISTVATGACVFIAVYLPTVLYDSEMISQAVENIKLILGIGGELSAVMRAAIITAAVSRVFSFVCSVFVVISAVTVGALLLKKRKLIGAMMLYLLINLLCESVINLLSITVSGILGDDLFEVAQLVSSVLEIVIYVAVCICSYFVNLRVLSKRFNID